MVVVGIPVIVAFILDTNSPTNTPDGKKWKERLATVVHRMVRGQLW